MSYCRWSSDDFTCDLYVYAAVYGGWTTHVAGRRHVIDPSVLGPWPKVTDPEDKAQVEAWGDRYRRMMALVGDSVMEDINLPHAGESFADDSPGECADRVESLRALGYKVPDSAITRLRAEQAELDEAKLRSEREAIQLCVSCGCTHDHPAQVDAVGPVRCILCRWCDGEFEGTRDES